MYCTGKEVIVLPILDIRARIFATENTNHHKHQQKEKRGHSHAHSVDSNVANKLITRK